MQRKDDELLLSYLLDGLSESERHELESRLEAEPALAKRLESLRNCLSDSDSGATDCGDQLTPEGLATRTADSIHGLTECPSQACSRWSITDVCVASCVAVLIACLFAPALLETRESARQRACENKLKQLADALMSYSDDRGHFPRIGPNENAGMFAVVLAEAGYLDRQELREILVCPASDLAQRIAVHAVSVRVPTRDEMRVAHSLMADRMRQTMAGTAAYNLGYIDPENRYVPLSKQGGSRVPLLSDAPQGDCITGLRFNHGVCGQYVFFQDGSLRFVSGNRLATGDDPYRNQEGEIAAGTNWADAVLAPSWATPSNSQHGVSKPNSLGASR